MVLGDWAQVRLVVLMTAFTFGIRINKIEIELTRLDKLDCSDSTCLHIDVVRRITLPMLPALDDASSICLRI